VLFLGAICNNAARSQWPVLTVQSCEGMKAPCTCCGTASRDAHPSADCGACSCHPWAGWQVFKQLVLEYRAAGGRGLPAASAAGADAAGSSSSSSTQADSQHDSDSQAQALQDQLRKLRLQVGASRQAARCTGGLNTLLLSCAQPAGAVQVWRVAEANAGHSVGQAGKWQGVSLCCCLQVQQRDNEIALLVNMLEGRNTSAAPGATRSGACGNRAASLGSSKSSAAGAEAADTASTSDAGGQGDARGRDGGAEPPVLSALLDASLLSDRHKAFDVFRQSYRQGQVSAVTPALDVCCNAGCAIRASAGWQLRGHCRVGLLVGARCHNTVQKHVGPRVDSAATVGSAVPGWNKPLTSRP
jgi:hypothetical protein